MKFNKRNILDKFDRAVIKLARDLKTQGVQIPPLVYFIKHEGEFEYAPKIDRRTLPKNAVVYSIKREIIEMFLESVKKYKLK